MKSRFWCGLGGLLLAGPAGAQSLAGAWQGVEDPGARREYPAVLRLQRGAGEALFGILYEEVGGEPGTSVTFRMEGTATAKALKLRHVDKLSETGGSPFNYWCDGVITFTYDAGQEKLTGHATYAPVGQCNTGEYTFYRVKLKSAARVPAGVASTLRVSGRAVQWFADPELTQPLASGNTYRTTLRKTTTFYLRQGYYPTAQSPVVPITVQVSGGAKAAPSRKPAPVAPATPPPPLATPPPAPAAPPDSVAKAPAPAFSLPASPAPLVLPTVLFRVGTAELLPASYPTLDQLAAALQAQPEVQLGIAGHTDRVGEPSKNRALSEQRATVVCAYLIKAGVSAERLHTRGYGDTQPLYPSPDARNRRVEISRQP